MSEGPLCVECDPKGTAKLDARKQRLAMEAVTLRNREIERRQQLFDQDPFCGTCHQTIANVEDCANVKLANGVEFLSHTACFGMQINQMALRYWNKGRPA